jgi:D-amino peptidase
LDLLRAFCYYIYYLNSVVPSLFNNSGPFKEILIFKSGAIMNDIIHVLSLSLILIGMVYSQNKNGIKVFISVDMEGITGVVSWEEVNRNGKDYDYFRGVMTDETNAAIEGALAAGATDIIVRDSHGSGRNILPSMLNKNSRLIRDWSGGYLSMMEGIDKSFDAVIFIGYHAKAGTPNAILEHTMSSSNLTDVSINNVSLPEAGINALIAGYYDVPVVFVSGEKELCKQAIDLLGNVETVAVKEGIGSAAINIHPQVAQEKIRAGVKSALENIRQYKPLKFNLPYTLVVTYKNEVMAHSKSYYPGVERIGNLQLSYKSQDLMELIKVFSWIH